MINSGVGIAPPERFRFTTLDTSGPVIPPRSTRQRQSDLKADIPTTSPAHTGSEDDEEEDHNKEDDDDEDEDDDEDGEEDEGSYYDDEEEGEVDPEEVIKKEKEEKNMHPEEKKYLSNMSDIEKRILEKTNK